MTATSDTRNTAPDVRYPPRGIGSPGQTFRCGACGQFRRLLGRKLQRVHGLRTWVCAGCAKTKGGR